MSKHSKYHVVQEGENMLVLRGSSRHSKYRIVQEDENTFVVQRRRWFIWWDVYLHDGSLVSAPIRDEHKSRAKAIEAINKQIQLEENMNKFPRVVWEEDK